MVGGEPEAPGVVVEGDGEEEADGEEGGEQELLAGGAEREEAREVGEEDGELGRHHVDHDGADEEAGLALEEGAAGGAVVADAEGGGEDPLAAAVGAAQQQRAALHEMARRGGARFWVYRETAGGAEKTFTVSY